MAGRLREAQRYQTVYDRQEFERASAQAQIDGDPLKDRTWMAFGVFEYLWNGWKQTQTAPFASQMLNMLERAVKLAYDTGCQVGTFWENLELLQYFDRLTEGRK